MPERCLKIARHYRAQRPDIVQLQIAAVLHLARFPAGGATQRQPEQHSVVVAKAIPCLHKNRVVAIVFEIARVESQRQFVFGVAKYLFDIQLVIRRCGRNIHKGTQIADGVVFQNGDELQFGQILHRVLIDVEQNGIHLLVGQEPQSFQFGSGGGVQVDGVSGGLHQVLLQLLIIHRSCLRQVFVDVADDVFRQRIRVGRERTHLDARHHGEQAYPT